jgi:hypothetical protein
MPEPTRIVASIYSDKAKGSGTLVDHFPPEEWINLEWSSSLHGGFRIATITVPRDLAQGWLYLQREGQEGRHFAHLEIEEGSDLRWEGRIIRPGVSWRRSGEQYLRIKAYGYWSSLRDQRITTVDYSSGTQAVDDIIKAFLDDKCPDIASDQTNIEAVGGNVQLTLGVDIYPMDHIIDSLAPLGDSSGNVYYAAVWDGRVFHYKARSIDNVDWEVSIRDCEGDVDQDAVHLRYKADGYDGATRTGTEEESGYSSVYPVRDAVVTVPSGTTAARAEDARDRFISERKDPQQSSRFTIFGDPLQGSGRYPQAAGNFRSAIRAGHVIKIYDLFGAGAASPTLDNLRTFYILEANYNASRDEVTFVPDRSPSSVDVLLARAGVEASR